jgi:hypothetical protein
MNYTRMRIARLVKWRMRQRIAHREQQRAQYMAVMQMLGPMIDPGVPDGTTKH